MLLMTTVRAVRTPFPLASLVVALASATVLLTAQTPPHRMVVRAGTLIDGTGAPPRPNSAILIEGDRIRQVDAAAADAAGATVIDASGKFILPGLIDSHAHYNGWEATLYPYWGVTTIFDLGNLTEWIVAQRAAIAKGHIPGPRLFTTGNHINGPPRPGEPILAADFAGWIHIVTDRATTLQALETLRSHGINALKIHYRLNDESLRTILEFSAKHDLPVVGHVLSAREAAQMGIRFIEHMDPIVHDTAADPDHPRERDMQPERFGEVIETLVDRKVHVNPTLLYTVQAISRHRDEFLAQDRELLPKLTSVPEFLKERWIDRYTVDEATAQDERANFEKVSLFLRQFVQRGGLLLSGSNAGRAMQPGRSLHREMRLLAEAGVPPMEIIKATTSDAARFYGMERDLGTVESGRKADLLILDADPLADIGNTERIAQVVLDGRPVKRTLTFTNPFPRPVSDEPTPVIESVTPLRLTRGQTPAVLRLSGRHFFTGSTVSIDGQVVPARRVDDRTFEVPVPASAVSAVGTYGVVVTAPLPAGGPSNQRYFFVDFEPAGSR
jgi:imidazolonepropionase-like amidohydrolase